MIDVDNWKWLDACFSSCGHLNSEIDANQSENREPSLPPFPSFENSRFDPTECGFPCEPLRVQRVISKWNWSIVLIDQFPPLISPNSRGTFRPVHDLSHRLGSPSLRTSSFRLEKYTREITCVAAGRWKTARAKVVYLFLMLTGGHVCGWRVAMCNQCARRV